MNAAPTTQTENEMSNEPKESVAAARAASRRQMERLAEMCDQVAFKCGPASLVVAASKIKKVSE
tara:strand:- start:408 stop:599 length:192 start_codon:yes stop_codon:yes gene_type:complete